MVDYIPIDDSEIEPEAPLTTSLGVRWRDNPLAIAEGAPGAQRIQTGAYASSSVDQTAIASGAVGQSQLKTTTGTTSLSASPGDTDESIAPGGQWTLSYESEVSDSTLLGVGASSGSPYANRVNLNNTNQTGARSGSFRTRYVQSSPPYDHGDGPVQGYNYATLDENGRVISMYLAEDPPWYGNTQHTPVEQWRDPETGKEYQRTRKLKCCKRDVDEGRISMAEFIERAGVCEDVVEEITPEVKLRGMEELPHPFHEKPDCTIVLLDPMDEKIGRLIRMTQAGENVHELFNDGYLIVDNEPCKRAGPPGVPVHEIKWRNT